MIIGLDASRAARAERTGTETYALEMIHALSKRAGPDLRLRLYTPHPPQHTRWPDSAYVETRVIPWPRLWTHLRLAFELWRHPPNVLFVPSHVLPLFCPVPAAVTVHDLGYLYYPQAHRPLARRYLDWTTRRHARLAEAIIADSRATRDSLVGAYQAQPDRIHVVWLGRDETLSRVKDAGVIRAVRRKYRLPDCYLLTIGTLQPRKNLVRLVEAFHQVISDAQSRKSGGGNPNVGGLALVIAGKRGWLYDELFTRVKALGLEHRVLFPGYVDEADKAALISGALAYVFPSLYEGFGLPLLEAMACGTPVLSGNASSLPEIADDAALLVDPRDTRAIARGVQRLVSEPDLRRELVRRGYRRVRVFSWDRAADQVLEVLFRISDVRSQTPDI
ncbi:MAG: glycosyltransferase family 4 protein [Anaerolineae bacterium]